MSDGVSPERAVRRTGRRADEPWWPTFNEAVLSWLNTLDPDTMGRDDAVAVEDITAYGTDWAGDTEGGFYPEFEMTIQYMTRHGAERMRVSGELLESLWMFVMRSWPDPAEVDR